MEIKFLLQALDPLWKPKESAIKAMKKTYKLGANFGAVTKLDFIEAIDK